MLAAMRRSPRRAGRRPPLPFLVTDGVPQQKIFEDEFSLTGGKLCTAGTAGYRMIDSLQQGVALHDLIKRIAIRAVENSCLTA